MTAGTHDPILVGLSVLIATAASFAALDLAGRVRSSSGATSYVWLAAAAFAMGGGIWAMHFVAMLALNVPGIQPDYDLPLTALSLIVPIIATSVAFLAVRSREVGATPLALGGLLMGLGIVAMHYTGMTAMNATVRHQPFWIAVSVAIAIGASTTALALAFRSSGSGPRLVACVVMGLAVSGMHYSAMQGAVFEPSVAATPAAAHGGLGATALAFAVAGATFLILLLALMAAMFHRRFVDLGEREAEALRQSEARMRLLLRSVTDYAIFMLDADGRVASWNSGAERIKGYTAEEIIGSHVSRFYREEDRRSGIPAKALATAREKGNFEAEGWRVRKDGTRFWASVVIDAIRDDHGELVGFAKVTRDVTERREAQQALQEAQYALAQSQKMEALGQLTGGVAHDFNNLLTIVVGSMELLRKRCEGDPRALRLVDNAHQAATRGAALTQRMLAFARRQELKPAPVDLAELVRGMTDLLQRTIGPSIRIDARFPDGLPPVLVDRNQLELALLNLVVNARDAMPDGGVITIVGRQGDPGGERGAMVGLSIADQGEGMDEATLARAREPFFTTKPVGRGTGLGLSMVHGLAEQSDGLLTLDSRKGEGTTAEIWLPIATRTSADEAGQGDEAAEGPSEPLLIVVADDDELVLQNTITIIEDLGHHPLAANSGEAALELLRKTPGVELVITDQAMPGMTGLQLVERMRAEFPTVPALLVTGYAELSPSESVPVPKLDKPFGRDALAAAVNAAVAASRGPKLDASKPRRSAQG